MARRSTRDDPESLRRELVKLLEDFESKLRDDDLRDQVQALVPANHTLRDLGSSLIREIDVHSASSRILAYLRKHPKTLLHGDELMVVGGISEYARRIRELRKEDGWPVLSGKALKDMADDDEDLRLMIDKAAIGPDSYYLLEDAQDRDAAFRWNTANRIRKSDLSVKNKLLEYLREHVGKSVTGEELKYLAKDRSEWARRIRELRTEDGWPIFTRVSGLPDLPVGVYVLEADRQAEVHDRKIPDPVRVAVLKRDDYSCRKCGWNHATREEADRLRNLIELHHITHHADGGENVLENLIALCNVCHDDVHRGNVQADELRGLIEA